jgi:hypothetical protein
VSTFFPSPDYPDWYDHLAFAGQTLFSDTPTIPGGGVYNGEVFYIGNTPGISVFIDIEGLDTPQPGWTVSLVFTDSVDNITRNSEAYSGVADCIIIDNLPVCANTMNVQVTNGLGADMSCTIQIAASQVGDRGSQFNFTAAALSANFGGGLYIAQADFANPSGPETDYYSPVLTPGWHWCNMSTTSDDPTAFVMVDLPPVDGVSTPPQIAVTAPGTSPEFFQQQLMIPNIQPRMRFVNTSGATVHQAGMLMRAKV